MGYPSCWPSGACATMFNYRRATAGTPEAPFLLLLLLVLLVLLLLCLLRVPSAWPGRQ